MHSQRPSIFRVIFTDYASFLTVFFPVVFGAFSFYFFITENDALRIFLPLALGAALLGIPILLRRYGAISKVLADGMPVKGVITGIGFFRGRGRVTYSYTYEGQKRTSENAIYRNVRTRKLRVGQKVTVVVDREDPGRAFIQDIYL